MEKSPLETRGFSFGGREELQIRGPFLEMFFNRSVVRFLLPVGPDYSFTCTAPIRSFTLAIW
jgi:hypothetical protein